MQLSGSWLCLADGRYQKEAGEWEEGEGRRAGVLLAAMWPSLSTAPLGQPLFRLQLSLNPGDAALAPFSLTTIRASSVASIWVPPHPSLVP